VKNFRTGKVIEKATSVKKKKAWNLFQPVADVEKRQLRKEAKKAYKIFIESKKMNRAELFSLLQHRVYESSPGSRRQVQSRQREVVHT